MSGASDRPPETEREPTEVGVADDQAARDRELLDYLIEVTWAAHIRKLRSKRQQGT